MSPTFRRAAVDDIAACVDIRGRTRENPASVEFLASIGVTHSSWTALVASDEGPGYVCEVQGKIVGYCFGSAKTGEIIVVAILPEYENMGIGKEVLRRMMEELRSRGHGRVFLGCCPDPNVRSYGFYRHLGWRSTGTKDKYGDEVLEYLLDEDPPA